MNFSVFWTHGLQIFFQYIVCPLIFFNKVFYIYDHFDYGQFPFLICVLHFKNYCLCRCFLLLKFHTTVFLFKGLFLM